MRPSSALLFLLVVVFWAQEGDCQFRSLIIRTARTTLCAGNRPCRFNRCVNRLPRADQDALLDDATSCGQRSGIGVNVLFFGASPSKSEVAQTTACMLDISPLARCVVNCVTANGPLCG